MPPFRGQALRFADPGPRGPGPGFSACLRLREAEDAGEVLAGVARRDARDILRGAGRDYLALHSPRSGPRATIAYALNPRTNQIDGHPADMAV